MLFSSLQSLGRLGRLGDTRDDSAEIPFQSFLQEALVSRSGMDRDVHPLFDIVHPAFPLPTTASPTLQGAMQDSFGEAVVACDSLSKTVHSLTAARRGSCGPTRKLTLLRTQSLVLCSKWEIRRSIPWSQYYIAFVTCHGARLCPPYFSLEGLLASVGD